MPTQEVEETILSQWQEPEITSSSTVATSLPVVGGVTLFAIGILIGLAIWQKDFTFYLAAAVALVAGLTVILQKRRPDVSLPVSLTTTRIIVGTKDYPLSDLAGFWLEESPGALVVNLEPKRSALVPITFLFDTLSEQEARQALLQVLPELEAREKTLSDTLNRYIHL
jgi:hypothetical protein